MGGRAWGGRAWGGLAGLAAAAALWPAAALAQDGGEAPAKPPPLEGQAPAPAAGAPAEAPEGGAAKPPADGQPDAPVSNAAPSPAAQPPASEATAAPASGQQSQQAPAQDPSAPGRPVREPGPTSERRGVVWTGSVGAASQYVSRGVRQSSGDPHVFGTVRATYGQASLDVAALTLDLRSTGDRATRAVVAVLPTWRFRWKPLGAQLVAGLGAYHYVNQPDDAHYDFQEVRVAASRTFGRTGLRLAAAWSPEYRRGLGVGWYSQAVVTHALTSKWNLTGAVSNQFVREAEPGGLNITAFTVGASYLVAPKTRLGVRGWTTSQDRRGPDYSDNLVIDLVRTF